MKKLILIAILVLISIPSYSYATGACLIKDKSAQVLLDYVKNNRIVIKNISNSISKNIKDPSSETFEDEVVKSIGEMEGVFNEIFSFPVYYSYVKYFAYFPISNEIPYEAKRDYKLLEDENNGLMYYLKKIISKGAGNIVVEKPCAGVEGYCDYKEEEKVKDILGKLIKNNENVLDLYRLTIMGENQNYKGEKIILVQNNFNLEIQKYYSREVVNVCNSEEGGFFKQIKEKISEITFLNEQGRDGIQEWKDAWQLLIGNKPDDEALVEKESLKEMLHSKGIITDYQEILVENLRKYNLEGVTLNNNFVKNTFDLIKTNTAKELKAFKEEILEDSVIIEDGKSVSISKIKRLEKNSETTKRIQERITILYENELPFAAIGDISTENLRAKIIEAHASLERSIKTLEKTIPKSRNVCNSQGGGGNCN